MHKITLIGATGRMGAMIRTVAREQKGNAVCFAHLCVSPNHADLGQLQQPEALPLEVFSESSVAESDVIIDFSLPTALLDHLAVVRAAGKPIVLGMTGLETAHHAQLIQAAHDIPVLLAPNTSFGAAVLRHLVRQAAQLLPAEYDIEVLERHHRMKLDSPSGTALALGQAAAEGRSIVHDKVMILDRHHRRSPRADDEIGYASLRSGGVYGDHEVSLTNAYEHITLGHRALDRRLFALGALRAAVWLSQKSAGQYTIDDMVGEMLGETLAANTGR